MTPEARAREQIDSLLAQAGWHLCGTQDANLHAARGVAIREVPLNTQDADGGSHPFPANCAYWHSLQMT